MNKNYTKKNTDLKKIVCVIIMVCLFCLIINIPTYAADNNARKIIKVGYFPFDGYHIQDKDGVKNGYGYDILQQMLVY